MAERRAAAGAMNVQRRTWDRDEFERRAKERSEKEVSGEALKEDKAAVRDTDLLCAVWPLRGARRYHVLFLCAVVGMKHR